MKSLLALTVAATFLSMSAHADIFIQTYHVENGFKKNGKLTRAIVYPESKQIMFSVSDVTDGGSVINFDVIKEAGLSNKEFLDILKEASKTDKKTTTLTVKSDGSMRIVQIVSIVIDNK